MDFGLELKRPKVLWRQVYAQFRRKILKGELPPGTKLPSTAVIARGTGTDVRTVHRAFTELVSEGFVTRARSVGTYVTDREMSLTRIGIYQTMEHPFVTNSLHLAIQNEVQKAARDRDLSVRLWNDYRKLKQQEEAPPDLYQAAKDRTIQGLITIEVNDRQIKWLKQLPIPITGLYQHFTSTVDLNHPSFVRVSLTSLRRNGCRSVALITPYPSEENLLRPFRDNAKELGLEAQTPWIAQNPCWRADETDRKELYSELTHEMNRAGYDCVRKLWATSPRPDGLIVYPDGIVPGVIEGLLAEGVRVPRDLRLVFHQHREMPYFSPLPASYTFSSVRDVSLALIKQLDDMLKGRGSQKVLVDFQGDDVRNST